MAQILKLWVRFLLRLTPRVKNAITRRLGVNDGQVSFRKQKKARGIQIRHQGVTPTRFGHKNRLDSRIITKCLHISDINHPYVLPGPATDSQSNVIGLRIWRIENLT